MDIIKYLAGIVIGVILILSFFIWIIRRRKNNAETQRKIDDKLREEALDRILVGTKKETKLKTPAPLPFDVKYDLDQRKTESKKKYGEIQQSPVMLLLTERSELSTRKYMLHVDSSITFGSRSGYNDIIVSAPRIAERQCEIFLLGKELYLKNLEPSRQVVIKRKKRVMKLEKDAVALQSGDILLLNGFTYEIDIM